MKDEATFKVLKALLAKEPTAFAQSLERLQAAEVAQILCEMHASESAFAIERLEPGFAATILQILPVEIRAALVSELPSREAALLLHRFEDSARADTIGRVEADVALRLEEAMQYPQDTAGGIMEPLATTLLSDLTVEQAIATIRAAPRGTVFYLYVVDRQRKLVGVLNTRDLLLAAPDQKITQIAHRNVVSVLASMDRQEVADVIRERGFLALPVVSEDGRLLGVVSHEQVVDAVEEEAFEDLQRMVGAGGDETTKSSVTTVVTRRLPWLMLNLVTTFVAAGIVGLFESVIAQVTALAVLLPVVAGQAGNSGAQSLAVVLRGLAVGEVEPGTIGGLLRKELLSGVINGLCVAFVCAAGVWIWSGSLPLAFVIGASMWMCLILSPLVGAGIPLALSRGGLDPAQSSTIFLTTFTELAGFGLFLGLAALCIQWLT